MPLPFSRSSRRHARGTSSIELLMVLPLAMLLLVAMVGIAQLMNLKQQSMHVARVAAFAQAISGQDTSAGTASAAVTGKNTWQVTSSPGRSPLAFLPVDGDELGKTIVDALEAASPFKQVEYRASGALGTPIWSREFMQLEAKARYLLPVGVWTSDECSVVFPLLKTYMMDKLF